MSNELAEVKPFVLMDAEDEKQIVAEMRGEIIKAYVYRYTDKGHTVEGLSKAGVDAVAMNLAMKKRPLRVLEQTVSEDDNYIKVIVKVGRYIINEDGTENLLDTTLGTKRQAKFYAGGKENPFAYEQAVVKAERNGKRKLMPEKIIIEMMKLYKNEGRMKDIEIPKSTSAKKTELGGKNGKSSSEKSRQSSTVSKTTNATNLALDLPNDHDINPTLLKSLTEAWEMADADQREQVLYDIGIQSTIEIKTNGRASQVYNKLADLVKEGK